MARIYNTTLTADGNAIISLKNKRKDTREIYTVHVYGTFGGGTVTAFTNPAGAASAAAGTTNDISIKNAYGTDISSTVKFSFDFECNSDPTNPIALKFVLAGATSPSLTIRVDDVS